MWSHVFDLQCAIALLCMPQSAAHRCQGIPVGLCSIYLLICQLMAIRPSVFVLFLIKLAGFTSILVLKLRFVVLSCSPIQGPWSYT